MYKSLNDELYKAILEYVKQDPGSQLCTIAENVGADKGTVNYRISILERLNLVKVERKRQYLAVYPTAS